MNDLTKPGSPYLEFQARVTEKLKTDIGSLMPEAALEEMVQQTVQEMFFKPTRIKDPNHYTGREIDGPSWFESELKTTVEPMLKKHIAEAVASHKTEIEEAIKRALESHHFSVALALSIGESVRETMKMNVYNLVQELANQGYLRR